jgi:bleomycin hydrolase
MKKYYAAILIIAITFSVFSQKKKKEKSEDIQFTEITSIKTSKVKSQDRAGTCWDYATTSFVETEAMRLGKKEFDLSEMYSVRFDYVTKAKYYIQVQGKGNFSPGGQAHDMMIVLKEHGLVPETAYPGLNYGDTIHRHGEMLDGLSGFLNGVNKASDKKLTTAWMSAVNGILDAYLGTPIDKFDYNGKTYTPIEFAKKEVGVNPDDYIEITSYTDAPFYTQYVLRIPDNWSYNFYYNLPMGDLMKIMNYSLENGYSFVFDGDVSEKTFNHRKRMAVLPMPSEENHYKLGLKEVEVTQEMRQKTFNSRETTDDHLMHITGMVKDQNEKIYYKTKNSWGSDSNDFGGYLYMSESYMKLKTVAIMVHKDAIPIDIAKKLGIK